MSVSLLDSHVYEDLFGTAEMRQIFADVAGLQRMLDVEAALAQVQAGLGLIPEAAAEEIAVRADINNLDLKEIADRTMLAAAPVAGLAKALGRACDGDAGRYVHWGATTQDIADTALVLQMRDGFKAIARQRTAVCTALAGLAERHRDTVMIGRTYQQHALPITFGFKCAGWLAALMDSGEALDFASSRAMRLQFSGAVGTLASLGDAGEKVAAELGNTLDLQVPEIAWHAHRGILAGAAAALSGLCGSLAKIATDLCLMSQTEIGEVAEPHVTGRGGSSTMPHKRNPVASTLILAIARNVHGLVSVMQSNLAADHERPVDSWQAEWLSLPQIFVLTSGALAHARFVLEGVEVDSQAMRANLEKTNGLVMAEALMMALSPELGHDRSHELLESACARAIETGQSLRRIAGDSSDIAALLSETELDRLFDPAGYVGSAPAAIDHVLSRWQKQTPAGHG